MDVEQALYWARKYLQETIELFHDEKGLDKEQLAFRFELLKEILEGKTMPRQDFEERQRNNGDF
jgi:hypothetical protein